MYTLIKNASIAYSNATGRVPNKIASRLLSRFGGELTPDQDKAMRDKLERDFQDFKKDEKITVQDRDTYSVGNAPKYKSTLMELESLLSMENIPRIVEPKDVPVLTGFTLALKDLIGDIDSAKKETTSTADGKRLLIRYMIKSDNFKDTYNLLSKLPGKTRGDKPFRTWLESNLFPYIEKDVLIKGKTEKVLDYSSTFKAQENGQGSIERDFIEPIRRDIRAEMNSERSKSQGKLDSEGLNKYQTRRASLVDVIRGLANKLLGL
jgi:hypothetical protein